MTLALERYVDQRARWPARGRHVLAQYDREGVVVYQAFRPSIAEFAVAHGCFGGEFGYGRMSWIKPNFLWMMYRCGWATKESQERVLAVRLRRGAFDAILAAVVHSTFVPGVYASEAQWREQLARSDVRLQWDPDHGPSGQPLERRAIQLGLRGAALAVYGRDAILAIEDVTALAREQHANVRGRELEALVTPREEVYPVGDPAVVARLGVDAHGA